MGKVAGEAPVYPGGEDNQQGGPEMDHVVERLRGIISEYDSVGMFTKSSEYMFEGI